MSINPTLNSNEGMSYHWNYSRPDKEGFSNELVGTVLNIQEIQAREYSMNGPGAPKFWPDGNPVMNIRMVFAIADGSIKTWTFQPAGRLAKQGKKKSVHIDLYALTGNTNMMNLVGQTVKIQTQQPPEGFSYGVNSPRPWHVELVPDVVYAPTVEVPAELMVEKVLCNDAASGGQLNNQQRQQAQPQPAPQPPMQNGYYAPPAPMPNAQPVYPQQQYAPQMQPQVQQGFQNLGVNPQQVQQVQPQTAGDVLLADEDIPF